MTLPRSFPKSGRLPALPALILLCLMGAAQDKVVQEARESIRSLGSTTLSDRVAAFEKLKTLGEAARGELEKASSNPDPEIAARTTTLLRRLDFAKVLPPELPKVLPEALDRLFQGEPSEWVAVYLELARTHSKTREGSKCLETLTERAFRAAANSSEKLTLCLALELPWSRAALPELVRLLQDADKDVRKGAREALEKLKSYEHDHEFTALLESKDPGMRIGAARALMDTFDVDALPLIVPCLHDLSAEVRTEVLERVYELRWEEHRSLGGWVKELIPLLEDPEERIRYVAASILGEERFSPATPRLMGCLNDPQPGVRQAAARSLGLLGAKEAAPRLETLLQDPLAEVRQTSAEALGKVGDREAIPLLLRSANASKTEVKVRVAATIALGELKAREAIGLGRTLIGDPEPALRRAAASLLLRLEDRESTAAIANLLKDQDPTMQEFLTSTIGESSPPEFILALLPLLEEKDAKIRRQILTLLDSTPVKEAYPAIVRCLSDPDPDVRSEAMQRVQELRLRDAEPELRKLLRHPQAETRNRAMDTLLGLLGKRSGPDFAPLLEDPSPVCRAKAVTLLGKLERPEDLHRFVLLLEDPDPTVQLAASWAVTASGRRAEADLRKLQAVGPEESRFQAMRRLASLGNRDVESGLISFLKSDRTSRQEEAIRGLAVLDATRAVDDIALLLQSPDAGVRKAAIEALGALGSNRILPSLRPLTQDREGTVRTASLEALAALGDRESIPTMIKLLDDPNPEACQAASRALGTLGARGAIPALENQLEAGKGRSEAIMALAALGAKDSARIIFRHLGELPWANSVVPEALGVLEARELIPELRPLLKHRYAFIRSEAAVALGELGDREATSDLLALLEDPHSFVRAGAADALGRLQAREAIPILRRMLREPEEDPASGGPPTEVVDALLRLQAREAIPELLLQVKRTHIGTLLPSLEALQQLGDSSTVPQLVSLLTSKDAPFRSEDATLLVEDRGRIPAIVACTGFGGLVDTFQTYSIPEILANLDAREYLPDIEKLLGLGSTDTRSAAAQALCRLGSTRGVPIILSEAANGYPRGLFALNALRRPLLWARMKGMRFPKTRDLTRRQVLETLAKTLGLRLEWVDRSWRSLSRPPCTRSSIRRFEDRSTLLEVAADEDFWIWSDLTLILEEDQIRVMWSDQATPFWTQWWAEQQKK